MDGSNGRSLLEGPLNLGLSFEKYGFQSLRGCGYLTLKSQGGTPIRDRLLTTLVAAAVLIALLTLQSPAQNQPPILSIRSNLVLVPATVQTKTGEILYGLRSDQFLLEDNGIRQQVHIEEDADARGLSLVVLVQCSRNAYRDLPKLRTLPTMVEAIVGDGTVPRNVAVVTYGTEPTLLGDFTRNPSELRQTLDSITPCKHDDNAATLDAVTYAAALLDDRKDNTRHAILLLSETRDHGSKTEPEQVIAALGRTNTLVDSVAFTPAKTQLLQELRDGSYGPTNYITLMVMAVQALRKNVPRELAALSGGEYANFTTQRGFDQALHQLSNHIHNDYLLSFQPTAPANGLHDLRLRIPDLPDLTIRARQSYFATGDSPISP